MGESFQFCNTPLAEHIKMRGAKSKEPKKYDFMRSYSVANIGCT